jgi:hypothetical protein
MNQPNPSIQPPPADVETHGFWKIAWAWLRGLVGAVAGGVAGWYTLGWLLSFGMLGLAIPGAFVGFGFGLASRRNVPLAGVFCGIVALIFGLYCDHATNVNGVDDTFVSYLSHLSTVNPINLIMIGVGTVVAYWLGKGR